MPPDLAFTAKIVEPWRGKGLRAFADWMCSTLERRLSAKAKSAGPITYGLFLSDSKACAQAWAPDQLMSKKFSMLAAAHRFEAEQRIAEQRRRESDERRHRLMNTPVEVSEAIQILDSEVPGWSRSRPRFAWLIQRKGGHISPGEALAGSKTSRTCSRCGDAGIAGSIVKRTLSFCECEYGRQELLDRGVNYIAAEIERVNASMKLRIVQACRELNLLYTGDAVQQHDTVVRDTESFVEIIAGVGAEICCDEHDLQAAMKYLGDGRIVRVRRRSNMNLQPPSPPDKAVIAEDVARALADYPREQTPPRREPALAQLLNFEFTPAMATKAH